MNVYTRMPLVAGNRNLAQTGLRKRITGSSVWHSRCAACVRPRSFHAVLRAPCPARFPLCLCLFGSILCCRQQLTESLLTAQSTSSIATSARESCPVVPGGALWEVSDWVWLGSQAQAQATHCGVGREVSREWVCSRAEA